MRESILKSLFLQLEDTSLEASHFMTVALSLLAKDMDEINLRGIIIYLTTIFNQYMSSEQ